MRMIAVILLGLLALSPAKAQADPYAWCADYGGENGPGTNCGFVTYEQCQWTISGNGGFCRRNAFYTGPAEGAAPRKAAKMRR